MGVCVWESAWRLIALSSVGSDHVINVIKSCGDIVTFFVSNLQFSAIYRMDINDIQQKFLVGVIGTGSQVGLQLFFYKNIYSKVT